MRWEQVRENSRICVGGLEVSPAEIEEVLSLHPDVDRAVVFPVPDAKSGETVGAAVVPRAGASLRPRDLKWFAYTHLPSHKIPNRIVVLESIPRIPRTGLAQALGLASSPSAGALPIQQGKFGMPVFVLGKIDRSRLRPGRAMYRIEIQRLTAPNTIEHAAAECIHAVRRVQPDGPYVLAASDSQQGVAMEMARQIEQAGDSVTLVTLFKSVQDSPEPPLRYDRFHLWAGRTVDASLIGLH